MDLLYASFTTDQWKTMAKAMEFQAKHLEDYLKCTNATDTQWQKVTDLKGLAKDIHLFVIGE